MSRFFQNASTSGSDVSDSEDSRASGIDSDEEERNHQVVEEPKQTTVKYTRNQYSSESDSDNDDHKKVIVSQSDKLLNELLTSSKLMLKGTETMDWVLVLTEFDKILKNTPKYNAMFQKNSTVPSIYTKSLALTEDGIKEALNDKIATKKLNATVAKALNALNQKIRKHNLSYAQQILLFRENPEAFNEEVTTPIIGNEADEESDDSMFGKEAASSESSSESEDDYRSGLTGRSRWLKKPSKKEKTGEELFAKSKPQKKAQKVDKVPIKEKDEDLLNHKSVPAFLDITVESLYKKLAQVLEARGKRNTDRLLQIQILRQLYTIAQSPYQKVRVLLILIPAQFDLSTTTSYMTESMWRNIATDIEALLKTVESYPQITIKDDVEEVENDLENEKILQAGKSLELLGNIGSYIDRLDKEFVKSLQNVDPFSDEYIDRLRLEIDLYALIVRAQLYFSQKETSSSSSALIIMCRLQHIYFKSPKLIQMMELNVKKSNPALESLLCSENIVDELCAELYKTTYDNLRTRAVLCHVYHYALLDQFPKAREMFLTSLVQDTITNADIPTQALFNRTMVQLGLSAFRCGNITEAVQCHQEIQHSGKVKELLTQGISTQRGVTEKTIEQEKAEKQRQVPYHMHINLELLECVYLVSSMLLEMPLIVANHYDSKKKSVSKPFRRFLDFHERQVFVGPSENSKDSIMAACRSIIVGDWKKVVEHVLSLKIWDVLANVDDIKEMLKQKIKEESICTFVIAFAKNCDTIGIQQLSERFELSKEIVVGKLASLIDSKMCPAKIEGDYFIFTEPAQTRLDYLTQMYAEKVAALIENNEKMADITATLGNIGEKVDYKKANKNKHRV